MADPILPSVYRAMWIFKGSSGLPEDRYVNNWIFRREAGGLLEDVTDAIHTVLTAFYNGSAPNGAKITNYLNGPGMSGAELRVYHLGDEPPRTPSLRTPVLNLPASGTPYPEEVSAVLSLTTAQRGPRGRGRIYLGPFLSTVATTTGGRAVISDTFRQTVKNRAEDVIGTSHNVEWGIVSKMDGVFRKVTGGFIDDAFDTQRSRGRAASVRVPIGGYVLAA